MEQDGLRRIYVTLGCILRVRLGKMSVYARLWTLKSPEEGDNYAGCGRIEIDAQGVPAHLSSSAPDSGYEEGDPPASFRPPPIETDEEGEAQCMWPVIFVTEYSLKGTDRSPQEYSSL